MKNLHFLIKPASNACNLRCRYCFYADVSEHRSAGYLGQMRDGTVAALLDAAFSAIDSGGNIHFGFQGGEPTLAGLPFFENFVARASGKTVPGITVSYSIQTNGTLLDDAWIRFLKENDFLVGLSLDGYAELHDLYRTNASGAGTWKQVQNTFFRLRAADVRTNLLCVVTAQCAKHPEKVYKEMKALGGTHMQFIPCLDPLESPRGSMGFSLTPKAYGSFLCRMFDLWYADWQRGTYRSIRLFEDYVNLLLGARNEITCASCGRCGGYFVVEGDGSVYPCDFFVLDQWKMGTLGENTLEEMTRSTPAQEFIQWGLTKPEACASCRWKMLCSGGCKRDWIQSPRRQNYYCEALQAFFSHAEGRLLLIAKKEYIARKHHSKISG